ncbi:MAG: 2Fe-2S iron-sulfur cluster-binding protein [Oligoflexus sp.]
MVKAHFEPDQCSFKADGATKLLVAARKAKADIKFGCASCQCGTCGVRIKDLQGELSPMRDNEKALLAKMKLATDGSIRLACQARILEGEVTVDLSFQEEYSPDVGVE